MVYGMYVDWDIRDQRYVGTIAPRGGGSFSGSWITTQLHEQPKQSQQYTRQEPIGLPPMVQVIGFSELQDP